MSNDDELGGDWGQPPDQGEQGGRPGENQSGQPSRPQPGPGEFPGAGPQTQGEQPQMGQPQNPPGVANAPGQQPSPGSPQQPGGPPQQGPMIQKGKTTKPKLEQNDFIAIALSLVLPGVGHMMLGQQTKGLVILAAVFLTCGVGYVVNIAIAADAYFCAMARKERPLDDWEVFPDYDKYI